MTRTIMWESHQQPQKDRQCEVYIELQLQPISHQLQQSNQDVKEQKCALRAFKASRSI